MFPVFFAIGVPVRDTGAKGQPHPQKILKKFRHMLGKMKKIRAHVSQNILHSGNFITIFHKTFKCPPSLGKYQARTLTVFSELHLVF